MTNISLIASSFTAATLAPVGSLTRIDQAQEWVYAAMYQVNDSAVQYALSALKGWETLGRMSPATRNAFDTLVSECETYIHQAAEA